jgi:hypothetical protein
VDPRVRQEHGIGPVVRLGCAAVFFHSPIAAQRARS